MVLSLKNAKFEALAPIAVNIIRHSAISIKMQFTEYVSLIHTQGFHFTSSKTLATVLRTEITSLCTELHGVLARNKTIKRSGPRSILDFSRRVKKCCPKPFVL